MRAGVATLQQTLTPDAAAVLKRAAGDAARRGHAQVTPLHVAASLLLSPSGLLQQACLQSHRHLQHPLQCRALELCFNVALERLPSAATATAAAATDVGGPAPLSNALVAALKRAQAHQRRGCPEQQQVPLLAVRVEMEQLVISILDDPSVSRVMREAGFSSTKAKNSLESIAAAAATSTCVAAAAAAAAAAVGSTMVTGRSAAAGFFPFAPLQPAAVDDDGAAKLKHHQQLAFFQPVPGSIPSRPNPARGFEPGISRDVESSLAVLASARRRRNPILIGDEAATGRVLAEVLKRIGDGGDGPLEGARIISAADKAEAVKAIDEEAGRSIPLVACLGNLAWCLEPAAAAVMVDLARLLAEAEAGKRRLWYVGIATSQTYTRFLAQHPSMENSLGLQPLPVSCTIRPRFSSIEKDESPTLSVQGRLPKMPFRILEEPTNSNADELSCCSDCNAKFEHESLLQYQDFSESVQSSSGESFPFWLKNGRNLKSTTQLRPQSHEQLLEVRRKWSRICHILHSSSRKSCFAALPSLLNDSTSSSSQTSSAEGKVDNASRGVPKASNSWLSLSTAAGSGRNLDSKQDETGLSLGLSPSKSVVTDLSLGGTVQQRDRLQDTSACTRQSDSQATVDTFKRLYAGLNERVPWQNEAVGAVASTVTQCRLDPDRRRRGTTAKNDIWLGFTGPDRMGKRRLARGLAELVFGSRDKYALLSLSGQRRPSWSVEEPSSRGKTVLDRLAEVVSRNRSFCVVVLEDFDEADSMVRKSLVKAMERGKLMDSKGRDVSLGDAILVLSCSGSASKSCWRRFQGIEDRLLAIEPCSMKVVPGTEEEVVDVDSGELVVSIVDFMPSGMKQRIRVLGDATPGQKRKARWSKALEHGKAAAVDLNLGLGCSSEETRSNKGMQVLGQAASSIDKVVEFKEVDFDELVGTVVQAVESVVLENGLSRLEVDVNCIEAMVTALWEDGEVFQKWVDGSFAGALARRRGSSVLQLRIDEDRGGGNGLLGPVRECTII